MNIDPKTRDALDSMIRCLDGGIVGNKEAIEAAYRLGQFDGQLQMAKAGQRVAEAVLVL